MSAPALPWSLVKGSALTHRRALLEQLVTADQADVLALQIEIRTIDQFIAWFEAGAPQERMIGEDETAALY